MKNAKSRLLAFSVYLFLLLSLSSHAQDRCPYNGPQVPANRHSSTADNFTIADTVDNFTITDTEGNTYDLYQTLDSGMTVFIDLFYTRCNYCQQYAPIIEQIYQNIGAGEENVLMWGISDDPYDTDAIIDQYKSDYGITNPCAGPQGGGTSALSTIIAGQTFNGYPTYCVICPDHTMYFDPVYPPTVTGFNPYLENCAAMVEVDERPMVPPPGPIIAMYPNPVRNILHLELNGDSFQDITIELFNLTGTSVLRKEHWLDKGASSLALDLSVLPAGYYFLKFSSDRQFLEVRRVIVQ